MMVTAVVSAPLQRAVGEQAHRDTAAPATAGLRSSG